VKASYPHGKATLVCGSRAREQGQNRAGGRDWRASCLPKPGERCGVSEIFGGKVLLIIVKFSKINSFSYTVRDAISPSRHLPLRQQLALGSHNSQHHISYIWLW
jgi:hypothetical protein